MITDERLRAAAEKSSDLYLCCMEEGYDAIPPHEFSEPFERKIRKLKKRADHPYFYKMMHKVAVIILAVLIGGSAWLAVDTEARASFFGWVKEVYEELFIYHFEDGRTSNEGKNNYYLTWIPEGYTQILEDSVGNTSSVIYMNDEGEILKFYYASPPDETFWQIESTNTAVEKVTVDGCTADILISVIADSGIESDLITSTCATDHAAAAKLAADHLCEAIGNSGEVAIVAHQYNTESSVERVEAFKKEIEEKYTDVKVVQVNYGDGEESIADMLKNTLETYPALKGIFCTNEDMADQTLDALADMENTEQIQIVGFDSGEKQQKAIQEGREYGTVTRMKNSIHFIRFLPLR